MKRTIIDLQKEQSERKHQRELIEAEIKSLDNKVLEYAAEAQKAAEAGNTDKYIEWKQKTDRASAEVYVKQAMLKNINDSFPRAEVIDAWNAYITEYSKGFNQQLIKYNKAVDSLRDLFTAMLDAQREALKYREYACTLAGVKRQSILEDNSVNGIFKMPFIPFTTTHVNESAAASFFFGGYDEGARKLANCLMKYHILKPIE